MGKDVFDRILARTPDSTKREVSMSIDIALRIHDIMKENGINQKELAAKLKKNESEVSKWLTGNHNFTLATIIKLEIALGEPILEVIGYSDDRYRKSKALPKRLSEIKSKFSQMTMDELSELQESGKLDETEFELFIQTMDNTISYKNMKTKHYFVDPSSEEFMVQEQRIEYAKS